MNDTISLGILDSLDLIQESSMDASVSVMTALFNEYEKLTANIQDSEECVYMEGEIWDTATGKGKVESNVWKTIAFLPRLLIGIIKAMASVFTKDNEVQITSSLDSIEKFTGVELERRTQSFNQQTNNQIIYKPEKKVFVLDKIFHHIRNSVEIIIGFSPLIAKAIQALRGKNEDFNNITNEIKRVLFGKTDKPEGVSYITIDTFRSLMNDGWGVALGIRGMTDELAMLIDNKINSEYKTSGTIDPNKVTLRNTLRSISQGTKNASNELKTSEMRFENRVNSGKIKQKDLSLENLLDAISKGYKHVSLVTRFFTTMFFGLKVFASPIRAVNKIKSKTNKNNARIKELEKEYKKLTRSKKSKPANTQRINEIEQEIKKLKSAPAVTNNN